MKHRGYREYPIVARMNGKPCPFLVVEGRLAKRLVGLSLIQQDLKAVSRMFQRMSEDVEDIIGNKALMFGALVLYGKCFTKAEGRGVKLEANAVFGTQGGLRENHDTMMRLRHTYVAHAGQASEEQLVVVLGLRPEEEGRGYLDLAAVGVSAHGVDDQARDECLQAIHYVEKHVSDAIRKTQVRLYREVTGKGLDWAYEHAFYPPL